MEQVQYERRARRRFRMELPVVISGTQGLPDAVGVTRDVNSAGIFVFVDSRFAALTEIQFTLTLPAEITLTDDVRVVCRGKVLRAEKGEGDKIGLAATIDHFAFQ